MANKNNYIAEEDLESLQCVAAEKFPIINWYNYLGSAVIKWLRPQQLWKLTPEQLNRYEKNAENIDEIKLLILAEISLLRVVLHWIE